MARQGSRPRGGAWRGRGLWLKGRDGRSGRGGAGDGRAASLTTSTLHLRTSPPPHIYTSTATAALATATFTTATFTTATFTTATIATTGRGRGARARLARLGPLQRREDVGVWLLGVEEVEGGGEVVPLERCLVRVAARERREVLVEGAGQVAQLE